MFSEEILKLQKQVEDAKDAFFKEKGYYPNVVYLPYQYKALVNNDTEKIIYICGLKVKEIMLLDENSIAVVKEDDNSTNRLEVPFIRFDNYQNKK